MNYTLKKLLLNINCAKFVHKKFIFQENNCLTRNILSILWKYGYVSSYIIVNNDKIKVFLRLSNNNILLKSIKNIYKPIKQTYFSVKQLWLINSSHLFIFSTCYGLKCLADCKVLNIGGQLIAVII